MRLLSDNQKERIIEHFTLLQNNNVYIAKKFRDINSNDIIMFTLRYIKPPLQHFKVLEDDMNDICKILHDDNIKIPIL